MSHEQVFVKVNAQVDSEIAPLVEALNAISEVVTVSSCQGDNSRDAYVAFVMGNEWQELGDFVRRLSTALGQDKHLDDISYSLSVEWYAGGDTPTGYLRVPHQHIQKLTEAVQRTSVNGLHHDDPAP